MKFRPYGLFGGLPAREARFFVELPDGTRRTLNSKTSPLTFPAGTILHFEPSGGGGYGDPAERPLERVQADLDDGYISVDAARTLYKVTVRDDPNRAEGPHLVVGREGRVQ
jgi:N-methylhydantoinase B